MRRHLLEIALEARRRDQFQQPGRLIPRVPERVWNAAWLHDELPRSGHRFIVADLHAHAALEHE